jgi:hypothetical protein
MSCVRLPVAKLCGTIHAIGAGPEPKDGQGTTSLANVMLADHDQEISA